MIKGLLVGSFCLVVVGSGNSFAWRTIWKLGTSTEGQFVFSGVESGLGFNSHYRKRWRINFFFIMTCLKTFGTCVKYIWDSLVMLGSI